LVLAERRTSGTSSTGFLFSTLLEGGITGITGITEATEKIGFDATFDQLDITPSTVSSAILLQSLQMACK